MAPVRGDLSGRPEEDNIFITATPEVQANEVCFNARAVLINIGQDRPRTEARHAFDAFRREFGIRDDSLRVSHHFPEDFFVLFDDPRVREDMLDRESFQSNGREFNILP